MSRITAIKLIQSLSKSEKRQFKLLSKKQSGNKDYLDLFDLIDKENITEETDLKQKFKVSHPQSSIDNAAAYLVKVLTDSLIQTGVKEDLQSQLLYGLLKINTLNQRNLTDAGFRELKKLQQIADNSNEQMIKLILYRQELNYYSENNFHDLSENNLVKVQTKGRNILKDHLNLHEHHALHELLKYRLIHTGKSLSEKDKDQLNDLILSEMGIVNSRAKNSMESKKIHLLFQAHFFTDIGDYRSALKTYYDLNRFFEKNITLLKQPPMDYFSALSGILDSLRTMLRYEEIDFYINKLRQLIRPEYPEYFKSLVSKTISIYTIAGFMGMNDYKGAIAYIKTLDKHLITDYSLIDEDKQNELIFYLALAYFNIKNFKKAQKHIGQIVSLKNNPSYSLIYRTASLLSILIHYEIKDMEFLDYEIRSYKRSTKNKSQPLKTEKLLFKVIQKNPDFNHKAKNEIIWKTIAPIISNIENDKYELQLLKYFNFMGWVRERFEK